MPKKYKIGFIIDPLAGLNIAMDTSLLMISEANARGHEVYYTTIDKLFLSENQLKVKWHRLEYTQGSDLLASEGQEFTSTADFCDAIVMRKDPPFDQRYLATTYLLD